MIDYKCENCLGNMSEYGCYCQYMGALRPGGPFPGDDEYIVEKSNYEENRFELVRTPGN